MADEQALLEKARHFENRIITSAKNNENILIASHHDADGICAAAILCEFIHKNKGHCQLRAVSEPNSRFLDRLGSSKFDLIIFVDICSGLSKEISKRFGDKWLIIDHHEIPQSELDVENELNSWQFGIDGNTAISSSGLCYLVAKTRSDRLSFLALTGALGDRQDVGPRRSVIGLNAKILEGDGEFQSGIDTKNDLMVWGRETRPVHESIANTVSIFIPGLTGNKDACLASLRAAGIELRAGNRWKTASEFGEDEKQRLLEAIVPHLSGTTYTVEDLVGSVYGLNSRDEYSTLRDARDLAVLINACSRMGKPSIGISICLGDEQVLANESDQLISDYRVEIVKSIQNLLSSEDRINEKGDYTMIVGDGVVSERMTGAICQFVASHSRFRTKVVFVRTTTSDGDVKISARSGREMTSYDLGSILSQIAAGTSGVGGGHKNAAGARFSIAKQHEFQQAVDSIFQQKRRN
ncbi:MAG TPA: DHHA1 domain-containing protein [Nitrososphaerales archaeon]|nr:DHHA1 domain-containing protein [Nitrososphaerales archaeon]